MVIPPKQFGEIVDLLGKPTYVKVTYKLPTKQGDLGRLASDAKGLFGPNTKIGRSIDMELQEPHDTTNPRNLPSGVDVQLLKNFYEASLKPGFGLGGGYVGDLPGGVSKGEDGPYRALGFRDEAIFYLKEIGWRFETGYHGVRGVLEVAVDHQKVKVTKQGQGHEIELLLAELLKREQIASTITEEIIVN